MAELAVELGRLRFPNPILVASGTFGYAKEMANWVDLNKLGGIVPKTITRLPRIGNKPPRTVETASGMLNAIGLDNDGIEHFIKNHLPFLTSLNVPILVNIAGKSTEEFTQMAEMLDPLAGIAGVELNLSCPNVSGGVDFAIDPEIAFNVIANVRRVCRLPLIAKLTPNVTSVVPIAQACRDAGADAVSLINTFVGMAIDWRRRKPVLGNITGGVSGPAIKPMALRIVWQVASKVKIPIIGVGGIRTIDDVMEFLIAGASAIQVGTANFFDPTIAGALVEKLPEALLEINAGSISEIVGTLKTA